MLCFLKVLKEVLPMNVDHLDHVVLTVQDIKATCAFYQKVLGMESVHFSPDRTALQFGQQKLNLHDQPVLECPHLFSSHSDRHLVRLEEVLTNSGRLARLLF